MTIRLCPACQQESLEEVCESGDWWWVCHECAYEEEIDE